MHGDFQDMCRTIEKLKTANQILSEGLAETLKAVEMATAHIESLQAELDTTKAELTTAKLSVKLMWHSVVTE